MAERVCPLAIAIAVVLTAGTAAAQEAQPRDLGRVFVQVAGQGEEMAGHLLDLGPSGITLLVDGVRREVPLESVLRVQTRGDSLWNGTLIGAAIGAVVFALVASEYGDAVYPGALLGTALYASLGASVDALIPGRTTLYRKTPRDARRSGAPAAAIAMKIHF
jgi:hypothetical protein